MSGVAATLPVGYLWECDSLQERVTVPVTADRDQIATDAALLQAAAGGDQRAFAALMRRESPRLLRVAVSMLHGSGEAEEVVQEAFLKLWQAAPDWEPRARAGTWLHQVVYRLAIDRLRRRRPGLDVENLEAVLPSGDPTPEALAEEDERARLIGEAMDRLPPRQRMAVMLAHHQGLPQAEAASVLEVTEDAYESLLARARRRLKELVAAAYDAASDTQSDAPGQEVRP